MKFFNLGSPCLEISGAAIEEETPIISHRLYVYEETVLVSIGQYYSVCHCFLYSGHRITKKTSLLSRAGSSGELNRKAGIRK